MARRNIRMTRARRTLPQLVVTANPTTLASVGNTYVGFPVEVTGGVAPYTASLVNAPAWMGMDIVDADSFTVGVGDVPTDAGTFPEITVRVEDSAATVKEVVFTLFVSAGALKLAPGTGFGQPGMIAAPTPTATPWPVQGETAVYVNSLAPEADNTCTLRHFFLNLSTFSAGDFLLAFEADSYSGIQKVRVSCNGNYVDLPGGRKDATYLANDGTTKPVWGYQIALDYAAALASSANNTLIVYAEAFSLDPSEPNRVIGPFRLYARQPGVGPVNQFDHSVELDKNIPMDLPGIAYRTMGAALLYFNTAGKARPRIQCKQQYDPGNDLATRTPWLPSSNLSTRRDYAMTLTTIENAPGVDVLIGDYSVTSANAAYDGIHVRRAPGVAGSLQMDFAACGPGTATTGWGGIFRGHTQSWNTFYVECIKMFDGAIPEEIGGTGSGSNAMKWGFDRGGYMVTRQSVGLGSPPLHFCVKDCEGTELSGYGIGFGELILNTNIDHVGGSASEGQWGSIHMSRISRMGGIYTGQRFHTPAFKLFGPPGSEFEKKGGNGRGKDKDYIPGPTPPGTQNYDEGIDIPVNGLYFYEAGAQVYYMPLDGGQTNTTDMVQDVLDRIDAAPELAAWSHTDMDPRTIMAAVFLSVSSNVPAAAISKRAVGTAGLDLTTVSDVHSNGIVIDNSNNIANLVWTCNIIHDSNGSACFTLAKVKNSAIHHNVFHSVSPSEQPSVFSRETVGLLYYANTHMGPGNTAVSTSNTICNPKCRFDHNTWNGLGKSNTTDANCVHKKSTIRVGTTPAGSLDCKNLAGAAESTLYANPSSTDMQWADVRPKLPLQLDDGSWAGAIDGAGDWNPV